MNKISETESLWVLSLSFAACDSLNASWSEDEEEHIWHDEEPWLMGVKFI